MSAVSAESPESAADRTRQASTVSTNAGPANPGPASAGQANGRVSAPDTGSPGSGTDFGPNEWLVDELYQKYQADPGSVDRAWWNFFTDYRPKPAEPPRAAPPAQRPAAQAPQGPARQAQDGQARDGQAPGARGTAAPPASPAPASPAPAKALAKALVTVRPTRRPPVTDGPRPWRPSRPG